MGSGASLESVQDLNAEQLAQLAVDNKCPSVVKKIIEELEIDGATLQEMKDGDFDELGAKNVIQKRQLLGAFHRLSPKASPGTVGSPGAGTRGGNVAPPKKTEDNGDGLRAQLELHDVSFKDLFRQRYAIICACDNYGESYGSSLPKLKFAVSDARLYERTLKALGMEVKLLLNEECNTDSIITALDEALQRFGEAYEVAQFMFIYAGHGVPDKAGRGWIAPYGFQGSKLHGTGLRMNKIKDFAEEIGASQQLWIFDCCHAGNVLLGGRGDTDTDFALSQARRPVIQAMTAVTKDQKAIEKEGNGVFSKVFCAKLEHMENKYATFSELETHVNPRVFEYSGGKMAPQFGKMLWDHYGKPCDGQFVFFNANDPPIAKMSTPAAATGGTRGGAGTAAAGAKAKREAGEKAKREAVRAVKKRIDDAEEKEDCSIVMTALKEAGEAEVAAYALKSLVYFAKGTDRKGKVVELGGLKAAVEAMRKFDADAEVQRGGADVLAWMASTGTEMGQKIASEGGIEVFLKAVRGFPDNEKVLEENLCALGNLADNNPDNKVKIAEKGGIELAIEALKRHPGNEGVQKHGCYVLFWMAQLKSAHPKIIKGKEQLEYAKSTYPNHAKIQKWSKIALEAL